MEAAAAGTPVIAYGCGALPETVEHGRTGLLVDNVQEMESAIGRVGDIDPATCRAVARARFGADRMTARTIDRYQALVRGG